MILDQVKASLAIENLTLTAIEEELLQNFAEGKISIEELKEVLVHLQQQETQVA